VPGGCPREPAAQHAPVLCRLFTVFPTCGSFDSPLSPDQHSPPGDGESLTTVTRGGRTRKLHAAPSQGVARTKA